MKAVALTTELQTWLNHEPARREAFRRRYLAELEQKGDLILLLLQRTKEGTATFVYATHSPEQNSGVVLRDFLTAMG